MDGIPDQIELAFSSLASTVDNEGEWWQLILRITADFRIRIGTSSFYSEVDFPIVEFAVETQKWLVGRKGSFVYSSMESDENPLLSFNLSSKEKYTVQSPHQIFRYDEEISESHLAEVLSLFIIDVTTRIHRELGFDVNIALLATNPSL